MAFKDYRNFNKENMTAKKLLAPRFEVIALYPNSKHKIGDVLIPINDKHIYFDSFSMDHADLVKNPEKYPCVFRKMNWWEKRTKEQMPKKLKTLASKDCENFDIEKEEVLEILEWDMSGMMGFLNIEKTKVCDLTLWSPEYGYIPVD